MHARSIVHLRLANVEGFSDEYAQRACEINEWQIRHNTK